MRAELRPQPLAVLLARALAELERDRAVFGLPRRSFWRARPGLDLSVALPGGARAATPLGPAAGPHTQLAPNLVVAWLAGARTLELKTVQADDRLAIPRPCIDAADVGYNVEWSQELPLERSAEEYVTAWLLIHALAARGVADAAGTHFEASVGYDLGGIRSERVARFLDVMTDARGRIDVLRAGLPSGLAAVADVPVPERVVSGVTLSTFHGCPPEEIEAVVEHLMVRHGLDVVVKLNPTLLGFDEVEWLLRGHLGYSEVELDAGAFATDLDWARAVPMLLRLAEEARARGRGFGVKLTNTLVVRNTRRRLAGECVYLSGAPLHALAVTLADRLAAATGGALPMSFSAGVDAENFADVVAAGFAPVTTCTDLLRPTGYRRLPRYLKSLESEMERLGAATLDGYLLRRSAEAAPGAGEATPRAAALRHLHAYAERVIADSRYHASQHRSEPMREGPLRTLDCSACNNCVLVCPNGAFFAVDLPPQDVDAPDLVVENGGVRAHGARLVTIRDRQWLVWAGSCNACGNCDTFCPEEGGPYRVKPRLYDSRVDWESAAPDDGVLVEDGGRTIVARRDGRVLTLVRGAEGTTVTDGAIEARLDPRGVFQSARAIGGRPGHLLPLAEVRALLLLVDAAGAGLNPLSAARLPALRG